MNTSHRRAIGATIALGCAISLFAPTTAGAISADQIVTGGVASFESSPVPAFGVAGSHSFDWVQRAQAFDDLAYDWTNRGDFTTIMEDSTAYNMDPGETSFKMPAYWGDDRIQRLGTNNGDGYQESVTQFSSIISGTLIGIDKSNQPCNKPNLPSGVTTCNYVDMMRTFVHQGIGVAGNTPLLGKTGDGKDIPGTRDGWYQFLPNVLYYAMGSMYPDATDMDEILRGIADNYDAMVRQIGGANADFNMQDYDFEEMKPIINAGWNQATDIGAATAAVLIWAHDHFGDAKYLQTAKWTMDAMDRSSENRYYEIITMLLPYLAARMNAMHGTNYDVAKYFQWLQYDTVARNGWGTIGGFRSAGTSPLRWASRTVSGLSGSLSDTGFDGDSSTRGYAFAMNSFVTTWLAAAAKYDTQYANTVGRWLLNVNTSARWFFADQVAANQQEGVISTQQTGQPGSSTGWKTDKRAGAIAYEGLQPHSGVGILATADVTHPERSGGWNLGPDSTNLGLYGSGWIGFMSVIKPTNVADVLRTDLNALDHFGNNAYPTSLIYNPTGSVAQVQIPLTGSRDLYDAVTGSYLARGASGQVTVPVPAGGSIVLVELPAGATLSTEGHTISANGEPIAYDVSPSRDLALAAGVGVSPTSVSAVTAASLVDGDFTTGWAATTTQAQNVVLDLGAEHSVGSALVAWGATHPADYTIATSTNGSSWTTATQVSSLGGRETATFTPRKARYVRVAIPIGTFDLRAIEVHLGDLARNVPVQVSSTTNTHHVGANLTDGSRFTRWESAATDAQNAQVDLRRAQQIGAVRINWEGAYGRDFRIETSLDGANWDVAKTITGATGGDQTIALPEGTQGRYVRFVGVQRGTEWSYSMWDFEVYGPTGVTRVGDITLGDIGSGGVIAGGALPIVGSGFTPGESITLAWQGGASSQVTADSTGAFTAEVVVPSITGEHTLTVTGLSSGVERSITVTVTPAAEVSVPTATVLKLSSSAVVADAKRPVVAEVSVTSGGAGAPAGTVIIAESGREIARGTVVAGSGKVTIPSSLAIGDHALTAEFRSVDMGRWRDSRSATKVLTVDKARVTTRVTIGKATVGKKTTATVRVTSTGTWRGGRVTLTGWGKTRKVTVPASGLARIKLPALKKSGKRTIVARTVATARQSASTHRQRISVVKAKPKVKISVKRSGGIASFRITVVKPKGVSATGRAAVSVNGKRVTTVRVSKSGKAKTARVAVRGRVKFAVKFAGNKALRTVTRTITVQAAR
ncbi:hypothetical protein GCM10010401_04360 [Rarobacter faecitabidus]|uniref:Ig-like domain-containing protein n=1 Tax=Rarobacter faecitabidus TaxID=13243 RepID=A0A542ZTX0_RARFA|nr:discoidin domain-containing protein [Rarobacter faecitabidus]TQL63808.1 Ig-like domain-containing protein [Rarobacter faecitabidus]